MTSTPDMPAGHSPGGPAGYAPGGSTPDGYAPGGSTPVGSAPGGSAPDGSAAGDPAAGGPRRRGPLNGRLSLRPRGLWLVTSLELRQRIRSVRWYVALGIWTVVLAGIGVLGLAPTMYTAQWGSVGPVAAVIFSLQMILVLFAMLLVVPALSAGSINGDRTAGTLATLQASLLSPLEIVLGKLLAGWLTGLAFLVLAIPSALPTALLGGIGALYLLRIALMIAALTLCVTAVGLGLSAITNRQLGSVVLAYVIVFGVTVVLPITWGISGFFLIQEREVTTYIPNYTVADGPDSTPRCEETTREQRISRLDLTQPLMWPNPVVLLAETAPVLDLTGAWVDDQRTDALQLIKGGMRYTSSPAHPANFVHCDPAAAGYPEEIGELPDRPLWPIGLGVWVLAGAGAVAVAVWRVSVPIKHLGKGTRIA